MARRRVLIVDDRLNFCRSLAGNLDNVGFSCTYATSAVDAVARISTDFFRAVLLDVALGDDDGLELLQRIREMRPTLPVIMITGYGTIELAVKSMKLGAFDFCQKPVDFNRLVTIIEHALKVTDLSTENSELRRRILELSPRFVTQNDELMALCERAKKFASTNMPVLICGESGTGKEILAEFVHNASDRRARELFKVNCAAFPDNLLDNELFGHEKGAFTGADQVFIGVFERAHGSTLLLDELGDMSLASQGKILRSIQNNEIRRIGGAATIHVDVRFLGSTNKDLRVLMEEKNFREDLYYRLNGAVLSIPPLRKRRDDIPILIDHFLREFSSENGKAVTSVDGNVLEKLIAYDWPGNIRELRNVVNYAAVLTATNRISLGDLPPLFSREGEMIASGRPPLEENEKQLIVAMLERYGYNKFRTAEALNITRKTLYNKMKKHGIPVRR